MKSSKKYQKNSYLSSPSDPGTIIIQNMTHTPKITQSKLDQLNYLLDKIEKDAKNFDEFPDFDEYYLKRYVAIMYSTMKLMTEHPIDLIDINASIGIWTDECQFFNINEDKYENKGTKKYEWLRKCVINNLFKYKDYCDRCGFTIISKNIEDLLNYDRTGTNSLYC